MKTKSTLSNPPMQTERMPNGDRKLLKELIFEIEGKQYRIEKGYITDYSTIPFFGRFVVRWSKVDLAGVLHDWLYEKGSLSKREADKLWRTVARSGKHRANCLQAGICWFGLFIGAWCAWIKHDKSREKYSTNTRGSE